ncbi:hypothetical protein JCM11491_005701 [Sporobolomyces phaffii]
MFEVAFICSLEASRSDSRAVLSRSNPTGVISPARDGDLIYGVFIKAASLCFAADAYDAEHCTLLAVDLICARRNNGRLSSTSAIARVPVEVWLLVQQELVDQAIERAEHSGVKHYYCKCKGCRKLITPPERCTWRGFVENMDAWEVFHDEGGMEGMLSHRSERIKSLLDAFGLVLPLDAFYCTRTSEVSNYNVDALEALGLPLRLTDAVIAPSIDAKNSPGRSSSVVQVAHSLFPLQLERTLCLKRFLALFNLVVENPSSPTLCYAARVPPLDNAPADSCSSASKELTLSDAQSRTDANNMTNEQGHNLVCCSNPRTDPHWHFVTTI